MSQKPNLDEQMRELFFSLPEAAAKGGHVAVKEVARKAAELLAGEVRR